MLSIQPSDRVLEIGSGNRPRKRSNVLCDRYPWDNTERSSGDQIVLDGRPFVVADAAALPFKDNSFDYVITSHILEHVDDPLRVAAELQRVAHAGYIETPSELSERLFGWSFHKWMIHCEGNVLVFRPRFTDSIFGDYFHALHAGDRMFGEIMDTHADDFFVRYEWRTSIPIRVERSHSAAVLFNAPASTAEPLPALNVRSLRILHTIMEPFLRVSRRLRNFHE
jgi:hypothetical protein